MNGNTQTSLGVDPEKDNFKPLAPGMFDAIRQDLGWDQSGDQLGKTVFKPSDVDTPENSVFIATKGLCDPHGYPEDHADFCVEAYGPEVSNNSDVEYHFFDDHEKALAKVAELMNRL